ncbi:MAG: glycosyltransferase family 2 protein [Paludibacter sp.]|nr:glycosyltransferase family 2 protein [Paludibacter sp.]
MVNSNTTTSHFSIIPDEPSRETPSIMVAMPAYNEQERVGTTVAAVKPFADVVVVVDDGSKDNTIAVAEEAGAIVIRHRVNQGYGGALRTIFLTAQKYKPDILIILDTDGQHDPKDVPRFVEKIQEGYDVVIGSRFLEKKSADMIPGYRKLGMKVLDRATMMAAGNIRVSDSQCGYRAYAKSAYTVIHPSGKGMSVSSEILVQLSDHQLNVGEIPIKVRYDIDDTSSQNPFRHGVTVLMNVVRFVTIRRPVTAFGIPGLIVLVIGVILAVQALDISAKTGIWSPTITIVAGLMLVMGMLLCCVALILYAVAQMIQMTRDVY